MNLFEAMFMWWSAWGLFAYEPSCGLLYDYSVIW